MNESKKEPLDRGCGKGEFVGEFAKGERLSEKRE
jgi:hypothetical protein